MVRVYCDRQLVQSNAHKRLIVLKDVIHSTSTKHADRHLLLLKETNAKRHNPSAPSSNQLPVLYIK